MALYRQKQVYEIFYYGTMHEDQTDGIKILYPLSVVQEYINDCDAKVLLIEDIGDGGLRYHIQYWE